MKLTINYKTGIILTRDVYNVWFGDGNLYFTIKSNPSPIFVKPSKVPMEVISTYSITAETEDGCKCAAGTKCGDAEECYSGRCARCSEQ